MVRRIIGSSPRAIRCKRVAGFAVAAYRKAPLAALEAAAMEMQPTLWLLGTGLVMVLFGVGGDIARRRAPLAWHAHLPWNAAIFVGLALGLFCTVHLLGLIRA
jgi:hypothetical protein